MIIVCVLNRYSEKNYPGSTKFHSYRAKYLGSKSWCRFLWFGSSLKMNLVSQMTWEFSMSYEWSLDF